MYFDNDAHPHRNAKHTLTQNFKQCKLVLVEDNIYINKLFVDVEMKMLSRNVLKCLQILILSICTLKVSSSRA